MNQSDPHEDDPLTVLARLRLTEEQRREAKRSEHAELLASDRFQDALKSLARITSDFVECLRLAWHLTLRDTTFADTSLVHRSIDDWIQSATAIAAMAHQGIQAPVRRELRYMLELAVRALVVDQQYPDMLLDERVGALGSDNRVFDDLTEALILWFDDDQSRELRINLREAYGDACAYVHPSKRQIEERFRREARGAYIGFDTPEQLEEVNEAVKRVYDLVLALVCHAIGHAFTGDLYTTTLDHEPSWRFHRTKWMACVSRRFDYKHERQHPENYREQHQFMEQTALEFGRQLRARVDALRKATGGEE
jgi:hypothetical protein